VRLTSVVQNVLTAVKVAAVILIAAAGLLLYAPASSVGAGEAAPVLFHMDFWSSFGLALVAVFWTCDGWNEITYVAGEVKEPERTVPKALLIGTLLVLVLYALINASFLRVLGVAGIANSDRVAADAMIRILGPLGGSLTSLVVILSTLGTLNGATLTGPRIFFAMAVDGLFFPWARKVDSEYRTPSTAIALQALMAIPLVITWTFEQLATYFVFISLIFYALAALAVFHLRRSPKAPRPEYRTWGYPFTPIFFLLVSGGILANTLVRAPLQAIVALAILGAGVPAFYLWKRRWGSITSSIRMFF
jgi:APA family basic amino acid/polyamine antiporter